jgi:hypothetical protein
MISVEQRNAGAEYPVEVHFVGQAYLEARGRRFGETGSVKPDKVGGYRPRAC